MGMSSFQLGSLVLTALGLIFGSGWYINIRTGKKSKAEEKAAENKVVTEYAPASKGLKNSSTALLKFQIPVGGFHEVKFDNNEKLRFTVHAIGKEEFGEGLRKAECDFVEFSIGTAGHIVHGGKFTKSVDTNRFKVPVKNGDEEVYSVFHFFTHEDLAAMHFMRCFVGHVNPKTGEVYFDLFICRGWW